MYVRPETFEMQMEYLKKVFEILPLEELIQRKTNKKNDLGSKPFISITFDDGWFDNLENAIPVLESLKIPATIFLPTAYIGTGKIFWADQLAINLESFRLNHTHLNVISSRLTEKLDITDIKSDILGYINMNGREGGYSHRKNILDSLVEKLKIPTSDNRRDILKIISTTAKEFCKPPPTSSPMFLNWDQVRKISDNSLFTFGLHSHQHELMTKLNPEQRKDDILQCLQTFREQKVSHLPVFCYPNQDMNEETNKMLGDFGIPYSLGSISNMTNGHISFCRTGIHEDISSSKSLFSFRLWSNR